MVLAADLKHGILNLPGITPDARAKLRALLGEDYLQHHCFWGRGSYHNHLPHHLLAVYDLGAPPTLLQAIYDKEVQNLRPIALNGGSGAISPITETNCTKNLGDERAYEAYVAFFAAQVEARGAQGAFQHYVLTPEANQGAAQMLVRLVSGALHPIIQVGYGFEFGDERLVASGLAQTAVHSAQDLGAMAGIFDAAQAGAPTPPLLSLLLEFNTSPALVPVMPYDNDALIGKRFRDAFASGARGAEIARIVSKWALPHDAPPAFWADRVDEVLWAATLLLVATGKPGRAPRLDFFIMHMVTSALFLPALLERAGAHRGALLQVYARMVMAVLIIRGRPQLDARAIMAATPFPAAPGAAAGPAPHAGAFGDPRVGSETAAWPALFSGALHAPEAHLPKAIRSLALGAQRLGATPAGEVPGAVIDGKEAFPGAASVDGSLFVRAAGVAMDTLGWVGHGQAEASWDRSALGWEEAWKDGK